MSIWYEKAKTTGEAFFTNYELSIRQMMYHDFAVLIQ